MRLGVLLLRRGWPLREPCFDDLEILGSETVKIATSNKDGSQSFLRDTGNLIAVGEHEPALADIG